MSEGVLPVSEPVAPAMPAVMAFLLSRQSRAARTLGAPYPEADALAPILTAAARVPDHGKLEPWRFIVLATPALARIAAAVAARGEALGLEPEKTAKAAAHFAGSGLCVVVVTCPRPVEKVPQVEQVLSAGAVCLSLLNAAAAAGFAGNWLTGWPAYDAAIGAALGLAEGEGVAGFVHLGTATGAAPPDRPRPDLGRIVTWVAA